MKPPQTESKTYEESEKPQGRLALEGALRAIRDKAPLLGEDWASRKAALALKSWADQP